MKLGCLSHLAVVATAVAAGLGYFSFWWALIPAFVAGGFSLSNHPPSYSRIMASYERREWATFPSMLVMAVGMSLAVAAVVYWSTRYYAG